MKLHSHRHALDAANEVRTEALKSSGRFHILDVFQQRAENHLEFKAREVGTEAEVLADAERKMRVRITFDVELERFILNVLVAAGRGVIQYERFALFDFLPA